MTSLTLNRTFSKCIALMKSRDFEGARQILGTLPAGDIGPASKALRAKLEALLNTAPEALAPIASVAALASPLEPTPAPIPAPIPAPVPNSAPAREVSKREFPALARNKAQDAPLLTHIVRSDSNAASVLATDKIPTLPGVSIVAGCMNRERNLFKVLPSWLATDADEILIVDWSCDTPLWPALRAFADPRLKCVRIEGEPHWIASQAFNVGLRMASQEMIFKLDCDIEVTPDFIAQNWFAAGEYTRGYWKQAADAGQDDQVFTHGNVGAFKSDFRAIGGYDERILTYGWEDTDIYMRLAIDRGLAGRRLALSSMRHIDQEPELRLVNQVVAKQSFLGLFQPTEFEAAKNRSLTAMSTSWGQHSWAQDFVLQHVEANLSRGTRTTGPLRRQPELQSIAMTLAARQLTLWSAKSLPDFPVELLERTDFCRLLRDAHRYSATERLVAALRTRQGVHFIRCDDALMHSTIRKSLALIGEHSPTTRDRILIVEGTVALEVDVPGPGSSSGCYTASRELIDMLASTIDAQHLHDASVLEETLVNGESTCTCTTLSFDSLADEILVKAPKFASDLRTRFTDSKTPVPRSAMVTSLYDEQNLIRLVEYLTCVVLNLRVFDHVVICYESRDGMLHAVLSRIATRLALSPGRLVVLPYDVRPTFEQLFQVQHLLPADTTLAVANADIAFDASFAKLCELDMSSTIAVLSRWDVIAGGTNAGLIRLENGLPNTFSADAWITATPFKPDFFLDYPIGTMHCDSFINNQIGLSARYRAINPCFDVRVFHLHDERFNSSAQKQVRDDEMIRERYGAERKRNGGNDPIRGVGWSSIATAAKQDATSNLQQWRMKAIVIDLGSAGAELGGLLVFHLLRCFLPTVKDVLFMLRINEADASGTVGSMLARYKAHFKADDMLLDVADLPFDHALAKARGTLIQKLYPSDLLGALRSSDKDAIGRLIYEQLRWPREAGGKMLRVEAEIDLTSSQQFEFIQAVATNHSWVVESLRYFAESLERWSPERTLMLPFIPDLAEATIPGSPAVLSAAPRVSFVTSLFKGGAYLPEYLENVSLAAQQADGEIIIVDANGNDTDAVVIHGFMKEYPEAARRIQYVQLDNDPGLYNCWRVAIERSNAPLVTNANLDDRRSPMHTANLVARLERHPEWSGACGSISCVKTDGEKSWFALTANQVWFHGEGSRAFGFEDLYIRDDAGLVRSRSLMHCMPVWRKALHERHGWFDEERYGTSADWAFWLKCTKAGETFYFDEAVFGRYLMNPLSHNRRNDSNGAKELKIIEDFVGVKQAQAIKQ